MLPLADLCLSLVNVGSLKRAAVCVEEREWGGRGATFMGSKRSASSASTAAADAAKRKNASSK